MTGKATRAIGLLALLILWPAATSFAQYDVVQPGTLVRGNLWLSEGVADVISSGNNIGNRFRLGGEVQFGPDYRFIGGVAILDLISSGETSTDVGDISRDAVDFIFGFFIVPDRLWFKYALLLQNVSGNLVTGTYGTTGQSAGLGYRIFNKEKFNITVEFNYTYMQGEKEPIYSVSTNRLVTATFPPANILSLNFTFGYDIGGR